MPAKASRCCIPTSSTSPSTRPPRASTWPSRPDGVLLTPERAERILPVSSWIKVSCNAGTPESYARVHGASAKAFEQVFDNFRQAGEMRARNGWRCTLGFQIVALPHTMDDILPLARRVRDIGMDYLVVKPYMPHRNNQHHYDITYADYAALGDTLATLNTDRFSVIFRANAMQKWDEKKKPYERCLALPFWSYIDAGGSVWGCSVYLNDERLPLRQHQPDLVPRHLGRPAAPQVNGVRRRGSQHLRLQGLLPHG